MNITFGFGESDRQASLKMKSDFSNYIRKELAEESIFEKLDHEFLHNLCVKFIQAAPKFHFNKRDWEHFQICYPILAADYKKKVGILRGNYNAYRNDHPMSPDGFACLSFPFHVSFVMRDLEDEEINEYNKSIEVFDY